MNNQNLTRALNLYARTLEFTHENEFKIKSYQNAAEKIEGFPYLISEDNMNDIEGIGSAIALKIKEIITTGTFSQFENFFSTLPESCMEFFVVPGLSPKKAGQIYRELNVHSIDEMLQASRENKLLALKGFGKKTQEELIECLEYYKSNKGKFLYGHAVPISQTIFKEIQQQSSTLKISLTGEMRRGSNIVSGIEFLAGFENEIPDNLNFNGLRKDDSNSAPLAWRGFYDFINGTPKNNFEKYLNLLFPPVPVEIIFCRKAEFFRKLFITTGSKEHLKPLLKNAPMIPMSEEEIYRANNLPFIIPELRENLFEWEMIKENKISEHPVTLSDIKGVLHVHSRYSDGKNSISELATHCMKKGLSYLGITDHSKAAFYANGLNEERLIIQKNEIEKINREIAPFRIFHGIECDILSDGKLDFTDEILKELDFVIISIHSNLVMNEEKAMKRLLKALENPYVTMLGHPTGRLLLRRKGYPVDHQKMIDACADNKVMIEINSNTYRLDLDWKWLKYASDKGIIFSINPDAHRTEHIDYMQFGVTMARKGGIMPQQILNCMGVERVGEIFERKG